MNELKSIRDFLRYAVTEFEQKGVYCGHGVDNIMDEAWWLLAGALKLPLTERDLFLDARLRADEQTQLMSLIVERAEHKMPTAYLLQEAYLGGLKFYVDQRVLIPRSPIAELIEQRFSPWLSQDEEYMNILDLCTGSACLAILCAYTFPDVSVDALDISIDALDVAEKNRTAHHVEDRVHLFQSDLFNAIAHKQYQVIISNPPYVDAHDLKTMPKEYQHEPGLGLAAGEDGLSVVRRILAEAVNHLLPGGLLIVEVGNSRPALEAAYPELPFTWLEFERGGEGVFLLRREDLELR